MKEKQQGLWAILGANTIFGLNIPVTKALMESWMTPIGYTVTRMFFGVFIFWVIASFLKREQVHKKDFPIIFLGGVMGFVGTQFLFSKALQYTSPVIFSLLMALTPVVVLVLSSLFLKERVSLRKIIGIAISISGAILIIVLSNTGNEIAGNQFLGILFSVLCVLCYAGYLVMTRKVSMTYQPVTIAKWMFLISALVAIPFSFSGLENQRIYSGEGTVLAYAFLAFALLFSTTLAFFLMPYALKRLEASTVSIFMNLQPIIASIVAMLVGQDRFTWDKPLAVILVVVGVYLVTTQSKRKRKKMAYNKI
ncbi:DMT family transporter [Mangrovimonas futianensis]|uniref:DMT family transporter n=1 Tax=Mangrovimonas futianensis TaxID=2895523 RepID=UPI001E5BF5B2|nr:DMT family transporter [Mangrovimonas futianensis]MCF1422916.1 DMT family transporter [Mangrovimonas futianensis]